MEKLTVVTRYQRRPSRTSSLPATIITNLREIMLFSNSTKAKAWLLDFVLLARGKLAKGPWHTWIYAIRIAILSAWRYATWFYNIQEQSFLQTVATKLFFIEKQWMKKMWELKFITGTSANRFHLSGTGKNPCCKYIYDNQITSRVQDRCVRKHGFGLQTSEIIRRIARAFARLVLKIQKIECRCILT